MSANALLCKDIQCREISYNRRVVEVGYINVSVLKKPLHTNQSVEFTRERGPWSVSLSFLTITFYIEKK